MELLASRLLRWNLLDKDVKVSVYRSHQKGLKSFLYMESNLVACNDVDNLFTSINMAHTSVEWRVIIAFSKSCLKAILLHNINKLPSVPCNEVEATWVALTK